MDRISIKYIQEPAPRLFRPTVYIHQSDLKKTATEWKDNLLEALKIGSDESRTTVSSLCRKINTTEHYKIFEVQDSFLNVFRKWLPTICKMMMIWKQVLLQMTMIFN